MPPRGCSWPRRAAGSPLRATPLPLLPVELDASLWLAAHVGTISLGYAAALAAAALGHLWLARRILQPDDVATLGRLHAVLRALLRVALLLAAAGTLLGAAWADHAWGRFWDWDPKENGALFLVLWLATVLHAARARLLRAEGTAAGAAAVVFPVAFSWLAANLMRDGASLLWIRVRARRSRAPCRGLRARGAFSDGLRAASAFP